MVERRDTAYSIMLCVDVSQWSHRPGPGDSIAVSGCCLTVRPGEESSGVIAFDVIQETLRRTTLGCLQAGDAVNLEHAVTPQSLMGGHIVQGHVDGVGEIASIDTTADEHRIRLTIPSDLHPYIVPRGSIAVDGVSLTVAAVTEGGCEIALIPTTLQLTTLGALSVGDVVNIETDYIAKLVVQSMRR